MSHAPPSRGNRRRRRRRRTRSRSVLLAVSGVAVVAAAGFGGGVLLTGHHGSSGSTRAASPPGSSGSAAGDASHSATPPPSPSHSPSPTSPSPHTTPHHTSDAVDPHATFPANGPGEFRTARVSGQKIGSSGKLFRYEVKVENNLSQSPDDVSGEVRRVFADPRGWTARGAASFQQVTSGPHDFTVVVSTPGTVDRICGQGGLDTGGEVNCRVGKNVVVNIKRWLLASPYYQNSLSDYHALTINHEVGHFLGHGHSDCPGKGKPAPVMMQQIKGLHGCVANPWPYDRHGTYLTGPAVP